MCIRDRAYRVRREAGATLEAYLKNKVFAGASGITLDPDPADHEGFEAYTRRFTQALEAERAAVSHLKEAGAAFPAYRKEGQPHEHEAV